MAYNDDIAPTNYASRIVWQAPTSGVFFAAVSSYGGEYAGSYNLQVATTSPPVLPAISNQTMLVGGTMTLPVGGVSPSGLPLSYSAQDSASGQIALSVSGDVVTIRPQAAFTGSSFQVTVYASDGYETASRTFTVTLISPAQSQTKAVAARPSATVAAPLRPPMGRQNAAASASQAIDAAFAPMR